MKSRFSCPRSCPLAGERWCRFRPILDRLGPVQVNSHTAQIKVDFGDADTLRAAVESMRGEWLGQGSHKLFEGPVVGNGFRLPHWVYPLVVSDDGQLHYDDYRGQWGRVSDVEALKAAYSLAVAEQAARTQGWPTERTEAGELVIHHPSGGSLTVSPGGLLDATGFQGAGCHDAMMQLGLNLSELQAKPEYGQVAAEVQIPRN